VCEKTRVVGACGKKSTETKETKSSQEQNARLSQRKDKAGGETAIHASGQKKKTGHHDEKKGENGTSGIRKNHVRTPKGESSKRMGSGGDSSPPLIPEKGV